MNKALERDIDQLVQEVTMQATMKAALKAEQKAIKKATIQTVLRLYRAGKITESDAMEELEVSQEEFEYLLSSN